MSSALFMVLVAVFVGPVTVWMECDGHPSYVLMMAAVSFIKLFTPAIILIRNVK